MDLTDRVRGSCAAVAEHARYVRIDEDRVAAFAADLEVPERFDDAQFTPFGEPDVDLAFCLVMNAVNFGSGWFPVLRKLPGASGAVTLGRRLRARFERSGPWSPRELTSLTRNDVSETFGQDPGGPAGELMQLFTTALRDLGAFVLDRGGRYGDAVDDSAVVTAEGLTDMPLYRDVATHPAAGEVAFYKRAQLTAAAVHTTVRPLRDAGRLTAFADNLVPHVLRVDGVLRYDDALVARIEAGELLRPGSPEEVEIRACGVRACELVARHAGVPDMAVDFVLWNRGQGARYKSVPRHRARCAWY